MWQPYHYVANLVDNHPLPVALIGAEELPAPRDGVLVVDDMPRVWHHLLVHARKRVVASTGSTVSVDRHLLVGRNSTAMY